MCSLTSVGQIGSPSFRPVHVVASGLACAAPPPTNSLAYDVVIVGGGASGINSQNSSI